MASKKRKIDQKEKAPEPEPPSSSISASAASATASSGSAPKGAGLKLVLAGREAAPKITVICTVQMRQPAWCYFEDTAVSCAPFIHHFPVADLKPPSNEDTWTVQLADGWRMDFINGSCVPIQASPAQKYRNGGVWNEAQRTIKLDRVKTGRHEWTAEVLDIMTGSTHIFRIQL